MKLVIYNNQYQVVNVFENMNDVQVTSNSVIWRDGSLTGIKQNFIVLEDHIEVGDRVSEDIIELDRKTHVHKKDPIAENEVLKARVANLEETLLFVLDKGMA